MEASFALGARGAPRPRGRGTGPNDSLPSLVRPPSYRSPPLPLPPGGGFSAPPKAARPMEVSRAVGGPGNPVSGGGGGGPIVPLLS